jgi:hypothetical protein
MCCYSLVLYINRILQLCINQNLVCQGWLVNINLVNGWINRCKEGVVMNGIGQVVVMFLKYLKFFKLGIPQISSIESDCTLLWQNCSIKLSGLFFFPNMKTPL